VDCSTAILAKPFNFLQVRRSNNNLFLGYLDYASIEVFEEKAALFKYVLFNLEDLNEIYVTTVAKLVLHSTKLT
jgi:hypothetical protein